MAQYPLIICYVICTYSHIHIHIVSKQKYWMTFKYYNTIIGFKDKILKKKKNCGNAI